jgi:hypothetical protein
MLKLLLFAYTLNGGTCLLHILAYALHSIAGRQNQQTRRQCQNSLHSRAQLFGDVFNGFAGFLHILAYALHGIASGQNKHACAQRQDIFQDLFHDLPLSTNYKNK